MRSIVTPQYLREVMLPSLIGPGARYETKVGNVALQEAVDTALVSVERDLSTRFEITEFRSSFDPHGNAGPSPASGSDPAVEFEDGYDWPGPVPGDGWLRIRTRFRPVKTLIKAQLVLPGSTLSPVDVPHDWFRISEHQDLLIMPSMGSSPMIAPSLPFGVWSLVQQRVPRGLLLTYRAGFSDSDLAREPGLRRLVALRASIAAIPFVAMAMNPSGLTSQSADGLSQSRSNPYALKDVEDRLKAEADEALANIINRWDGPGLVVL